MKGTITYYLPLACSKSLFIAAYKKGETASLELITCYFKMIHGLSHAFSNQLTLTQTSYEKTIYVTNLFING
jgi:hypothetical protein